ncbi:CoA transferase [Pseudomonas aeruginosa]|uniref:CaiB/BaiF CoA transferase family protein n=1 Tax=Pseudomonas TaxID=286 RepID=UPI0018DF8FF3|nr:MULTISPECIES: CoA transferase [Pseudomonas]MCT0933285.1 CoA transferase [Pseudomonas aeruginosa]MCT1104556.1 CoA transferase [Pseudomonas aeruginosa]HBO2571877.1 CoA transferase [Pseudomonas aeruginosa]HBO2578107.1 CoA transferase [Pseudomonas aeruginosa]
MPRLHDKLIGASLGANVVKIEPPEGDNIRHVGPMRSHGMGHLFLHANHGKRSVVLDMKKPEGLEAALKLAEASDVFISNIRPKALERLGLGYEAVRQRNQRIVYVSCCGFDQSGPYASKPAYDDLIQGATGIPWIMECHNGREASYVPLTLADRITGLHAVYATTAALFSREVTGVGQSVEVPMFEVMTQFVLADHSGGMAYSPPIGPPGYDRLLTAHRRPYQTSDGSLCVLAYNDKHWHDLLAAIGEADGLAKDPRFKSQQSRAENIDFVYQQLATILRRDTTWAWRKLLDSIDVPNMPVNSIEALLSDPHHLATGYFETIDHPVEGGLKLPKSPTRWDGKRVGECQLPAPMLGQHSREVLQEIGLLDGEIDAMFANGSSAQCGPVMNS